MRETPDDSKRFVLPRRTLRGQNSGSPAVGLRFPPGRRRAPEPGVDRRRLLLLVALTCALPSLFLDGVPTISIRV